MSRITILYLEDSPLDAELTCSRLAKGNLDCDVRRVETCAEFSAALEQGRYDLILSDFALPDFDGSAALALTRQKCPDTPFIFVSGKLGEEVAIDTLKQGATDYVLKQRLDRLVPAVERALEEAAERKKHRRTKEALRLSEERMHVAVKNSPLILYTTDRNLRYSWVGKPYAGLEASELLGKRDDEIFPPKDAAELIALKQAVLTSGIGRRQIITLPNRNGTPAIYDVTAEPMRDGSDTLPGLTVAAVDITEQRQTESELRRRQAEIEALNERLQRAMTETHHRVKNNLQIIAAMLDMQRMDKQSVVPVTELEHLIRQVKTLAAIHDLLTQQAKTEGQAHSVHVRELFERLIPLLQNLTDAQNLTYGVETGVRLSVRQGTALALVINELVSNALKHGRNDVSIRFGLEQEAAVLYVHDAGEGFPVGFSPKNMAGTGLELIENLARWDLGGDVEYSNDPSGGATVTVTFPLEPVS